MKNKNGDILIKIEKQLKRWKEHFQEALNRPFSIDPPNQEPGPIIKSLKNGKAAGVDIIPPETIKAMNNSSTAMLHRLINNMWKTGSIQDYW